MMTTTEASVPGAIGRWPMAIRGFLCQNVAIGCAFGGYGVTVLPLQEQFGASRGTATLGMALTVLVMGLASPLAATLIGRIGLRWTMLCGAIFSGLGYVMLAFASSMAMVLMAYALPIGIGIALFGSVPSSVLASNWFRHNPGPALGFVNMPLSIAFLPMAGMAIIASHGLTGFYLSLAGLHLLLAPFIFGIVDAPVEMDSASAASADSRPHERMMTTRAILRRPIFWVAVLGAGALNAAGITSVSHLIALVVERGVPSGQAALLLSVMGGATIVGSLLVGLLVGRLGAALTLALIGMGVALGWLALSTTIGLMPMAAATLCMGVCSSGVFPAVNMLLAQVFGAGSLARAIGLFSMMSLPLTFGLPPLAGVLHDATGSYGPVVGVIVAGCGAMAALFLLTARLATRRRGADLAIAQA